jgi:hypothetical protein
MSQKQLQEEARLLREARTQVFLSYGQKLLLVMIACCGFATLQWLGEQKDAEETFRKARWKGRPEVVKAVVAQTTLEEADPNTAHSAVSKQLIPNTTTKQASGTTTYESPCPNVVGSAPSYFATREQMILAMQDLAEACVWANFRRTIKNATIKLEAAGDSPEPEKFANFADYIAKEEALATVTAKVAQKHVAARLVGMHLVQEPRQPVKAVGSQSTWDKVMARLGDKIQQAAGDDSSLHVFYEMLWYASLLMGVIASSILFMVLLHALPLTSGEGYWTTRISEILKSIPPRSVLAVPLVAAAIGGGTLAGSVAATQPGGQKRESAKPSSTSEPTPSSKPKTPNAPNPPGEPWTYRGGDTTTTIFNRGGDLAFLPPLVTLGRIETSLEMISNTSREFVEETRNARQRSASLPGFLLVPPLIDKEEPLAVKALQRVAALAKEQADIRKRIDEMADLKQLTQEVHTMAATMTAREATILDILQSERSRGDRQERVSAQSLGQTAEIDPRGFFARTFGKTYYAVGPLAPSIMDVHLKGVTGDAEREALVNLLTEMRKDPPCPEDEFQTNIRVGLKARLQIAKIEKVEETVEAFTRDHLPALLKICALRRY